MALPWALLAQQERAKMKSMRIDRRSMNAEREARMRERERAVQFSLDDGRRPGYDCAELESETGLPLSRHYDSED
jgi:hypothetical protein